MKMELLLTLKSPGQFRYIRFPPDLLARTEQVAAPDEVSEKARSAIEVSLYLVSNSAVTTQKGREHVMSRARGETGPSKDNVGHPQNEDNEITICHQCRMRELKRYSRKKQVDKRWNHESERIILVNENEFKTLAQPMDTESDLRKSVDFRMRILCYNRHQKDGDSGYRVVFTFKTFEGLLLEQHLSDVYHVDDCYKDVNAVHTDSAGAWQPRMLQNAMPAYPQLCTCTWEVTAATTNMCTAAMGNTGAHSFFCTE